jgi:hypothetical protein
MSNIRTADPLDLVLSEGTVCGDTYYVLEPVFGVAATLTWFGMEWDRMIAWCVETYGPGPIDGVWTPGARWYANNAKLWFKSTADRDFFILKWR